MVMLQDKFLDSPDSCTWSPQARHKRALVRRWAEPRCHQTALPDRSDVSGRVEYQGRSLGTTLEFSPPDSFDVIDDMVGRGRSGCGRANGPTTRR